MKHVRLKFKLGDKVLPLGTCHPAQARIMVQKELASWDDGELLLILRPAHSDFLDHDQEHLIHGPVFDPNVSKAELDRRLIWLKWFLEQSTKALCMVGQPGGSWGEVQTQDLDFQTELQYLATDFELEDTMTGEEVAAFFEDSGDLERLEALKGDLETMWESDWGWKPWSGSIRNVGGPTAGTPEDPPWAAEFSIGDGVTSPTEEPLGDTGCLTGEDLGDATMAKVWEAYKLNKPDTYIGPGVSLKAVEPQDAQPIKRQFRFIVPGRKIPTPV